MSEVAISAAHRSTDQVVADLRARIAALQGVSVASVSELTAGTEIAEVSGAALQGELPAHAELAHLIRLRAGSSYCTDSASLTLALAAGVSAGGRWVAAVGMDDFGIEAAQQSGADLSRMVLVPDPGQDWLDVTAALVDVVGLVVLRPPGSATTPASRAGVLAARLRRRSAALLVLGSWPGCAARFAVDQLSWVGPDRGSGRLQHRRAQVAVYRGGTPELVARGWWGAGVDAAAPPRPATHQQQWLWPA